MEYGDETIDFAAPWPRLSLVEQIAEHTGIDILSHQSVDTLKDAVAAARIPVDNQVSWAGLVDKLISAAVEPKLIQPTFLVDYPVQVSPARQADALRLAPSRAFRGHSPPAWR